MTYLKGYMKAVKTHLQETKPDRVAEFEKGAQAAAKKILGNFKDYEFYTGEGMNPDGCAGVNRISSSVELMPGFSSTGWSPFSTTGRTGPLLISPCEPPPPSRSLTVHV